MQLRKIIISRSRHDLITTHKVVPDATLVVTESEAHLYEHTGLEIVKIPDSVMGLGAVRNWVLDHFTEEIILMFDDDIKYLLSIMNVSPIRINDLDEVYDIIENTVSNAVEAGVTVFSFDQKGDCRKFRENRPFLLTSWVGSVVGIIGRKYRFTETNKFKVDADYSLQCLLYDRIVWIDTRYSFIPERDCNRGGCSLYRNSDSIVKEVEFLRRKWGRFIKITEGRGTYQLSLKVKRTQKIIL